MAPKAFSVAEFPKQIVELFAAVTIGNKFTATETFAVPVHPLISVPTTVYVVFEMGLTTGAPDKLPGIQEYEVAPLPVKVAELPIQMDGDEDPAVTIGKVLTNTETFAVSTHPFTSVPVTV